MNKFPYSQFNKIPAVSGCYIWVIDWSRLILHDFKSLQKRKSLLETIQRIYAPNPIELFANRLFLETQQQFGEDYQGILKITSKFANLNDWEIIAEDDELFKNVITIISDIEIPLYIGKSININSRIQQHLSLFNGINSIEDTIDQENEKVKLFGDRLNLLLKENEYLKHFILSVVIYELPQDKLIIAEKYLNQIYKPLLGIK
jgi:hypothetical protein